MKKKFNPQNKLSHPDSVSCLFQDPVAYILKFNKDFVTFTNISVLTNMSFFHKQYYCTKVHKPNKQPCVQATSD